MRLFLAIDIPSELKEQIGAAREKLAREVRSVKWVEDHNLHLTMKFLGEVAEDQVQEISAAARRAVQGYPRFKLEVGSPGFFPNANNPRVIWLAIKGHTEVALRIGTALDDSLIPLGFESDKRRRLHLTLGRVRSDVSREELVKNIQDFRGLSGKLDFEANQMVLYRSQLTSRGPIYSPVENFVFNG